MSAPGLFVGCSCLLLELDVSIWAISRGRVSIQRKFTRRLQASGLAVELPTRVKATRPGIRARGNVQSQSRLGRGHALPARPLSAPPCSWHMGKSMYSGWLCALRNWDQATALWPAQTGNMILPALPSTATWEAAFLTTPVWWFSNSSGHQTTRCEREVSEGRLGKEEDSQVHQPLTF